MGQLIAKTAAVEDIIADVGTTLDAAAAATAAGGIDWQTNAEAYLRPVFSVVTTVTADLVQALRDKTAATSARDAVDRATDQLLATGYDRVYNAVGRPGNGSDPNLTLLYPQGSSSYSDGPDDEQPERMGLLVELLAHRVHPRLDPALADEMATELRQAITRYAAAIVNQKGHRVRVAHLTALRAVLARTAQVQLSRLKKHWRGLGRSEADIHTIIPDRPAPLKAKAAPATAVTATTTTTVPPDPPV